MEKSVATAPHMLSNDGDRQIWCAETQPPSTVTISRDSSEVVVLVYRPGADLHDAHPRVPINQRSFMVNGLSARQLPDVVRDYARRTISG